MKTILPNISEWSWFSEEKQINFNGHLLAVGEHRIVVDPPPMNASDRAITQRGGGLDYIILTNRDHEREAANFREIFNCQVMAPELDAKEMTLPIDKTFKDGELLPGGFGLFSFRIKNLREKVPYFCSRVREYLLWEMRSLEILQVHCGCCLRKNIIIFFKPATISVDY